MATDLQTIESLERIKDAIKILIEEHEILSRHIAKQKRQIAWDKNGVYHPYSESREEH